MTFKEIKLLKHINLKNGKGIKMANRFFITGVQLGMLISIRESNERKKLADTIEENQFICDIENNQIKDFENQIKLLGEKFVENDIVKQKD
jgi:hypothetical protein